MDASTEKTLKQLEDMTEGMLRTLEQVDQIAQNFSRGDGGKQQRELFSKVESLASSLEELHEVPIAPELTVPFAVLDHIDKAENPDLYWKQVVDTTVEVRLCSYNHLFQYNLQLHVWLSAAERAAKQRQS